jgi:uncharacterized protein YbbK (DUF523 family)
MPRTILVSACLMGKACRYNGTHCLMEKIAELLYSEDDVIMICPEEMGGLFTPRAAGEIVDGTGDDVLNGKARVLAADGTDLTDYYVRGAYASLEAVTGKGIAFAILKSESPSCGCGQIPDGTFSGALRRGDGVTAALLKREGVTVWTDQDYLAHAGGK